MLTYDQYITVVGRVPKPGLEGLASLPDRLAKAHSRAPAPENNSHVTASGTGAEVGEDAGADKT